MLGSVRNRFACLVVVALLSACSGDGSINGSPLSGTGDPAPVLADAPARVQKILVVGGTSGIGLEVVRLGLARGHLVSAMARRPERMPLQHENLQVFAGDILDPLKLKRVVAGHETVVVSIGHPPTRKEVSVFSDGMRNVLDAMRAGGAGRLITVTGIGAGDSRGRGGFMYDRIVWPLMLQTVYEDKDRQEALVRMSHTEWTIVRPGFLTDDVAEGRYRAISDLDGVTSGKISRADVARFIVAALEQETYVGWTVLLSN
ncbi:MAG: SDR family oxidoreductase [Gammaproteobacteria bacterium]|nr:SDR family oxidoreductase [Gammaproteobacteria bacterium]